MIEVLLIMSNVYRFILAEQTAVFHHSILITNMISIVSSLVTQHWERSILP